MTATSSIATATSSLPQSGQRVVVASSMRPMLAGSAYDTASARAAAYAAARMVEFEGRQPRGDIALRAAEAVQS